jgi:hypothetical protein
MDASDVLSSSVQQTHDRLSSRFEESSAMMRTPGQPRKCFETIDTFLAIASKHLNAVDAALLPLVRKRVPDGSHVVHDYLRAARELELALAHVKAREYGSVFQAGRSWQAVWSDVGSALEAHRRSEFELCGLLADQLEAEALVQLTDRLYEAETSAPSRPHPYAPHTGLRGMVTRRVMHAADAFWDAAEGRMVPEPVRPEHKAPGKVAQYLLADPRFDEEEQPPR